MELSPILAELERMAPKLAVQYKLVNIADDLPVITLASRGRKRTQVGWYVPAVWKDQQEDVLAALAGIEATADERVLATKAEVVVATELLDNPVQTVGELLRQLVVHEQASRPNAKLDKWVGQNGYYPIVWQNTAWKYDHTALVDPDQESRGWSKWVPTENFAGVLESLGFNKSMFDVARVGEAVAVRKGSRMKKWRCNCTTVRCAVNLVAECGDCDTPFYWAEPNEEPPSIHYLTRPLSTDDAAVEHAANRAERQANPNRGWSTATMTGGH